MLAARPATRPPGNSRPPSPCRIGAARRPKSWVVGITNDRAACDLAGQPETAMPAESRTRSAPRDGQFPLHSAFSTSLPVLVPPPPAGQIGRATSRGNNQPWPFRRPPTAGSERACCARRMPGICSATACSSPICACRACRTWPSSAATWRTPRSAACSGRRAPPASVFTLADIGPLNILEAGPELAAHRHSPYPALADERVRYVGQPIVACMQPTRAQAEDLADLVELELEALPAVVDAVAAMRPGSPRVFEQLAGQRLHHQHRDRRRSDHRSPSRRSGCAASSA